MNWKVLNVEYVLDFRTIAGAICIGVATLLYYLYPRDHDQKRIRFKIVPFTAEDLEKAKITVPQVPIYLRKWINCKTEVSKNFRVTTYNVLAECYADSVKYDTCPRWALASEYRCRNLLREILHQQPDVVLLQEMDKYDEFWKSNMEKEGFSSLFKKRPSNYNAEGCGVFFRRSKFKLVKHVGMSFNHLKPSYHVPGGIFAQNIYKRNNVGLVALLEYLGDGKDQGRQVCVVTAHLHWDPKLSALKVLQAHELLEFVDNFLKANARKGIQTPLIIAGDFNSMPSSAVYELCATGKVSGRHPDFQQESSSRTYTHRFSLQSAYSVLNEPISNYTKDFKAAIDYIWFTKGTIELNAILDTIPTEELQRFPSFPTDEWSSDHLMLCSEFSLK